MTGWIRLGVRTVTATVLVLSPFGCGSEPIGPPRAAVSGSVDFNGQPLREGTIRFVPADGTKGPKIAVPIVGGRFQAPEDSGPVIGKHRIEIEAPAAGELAMDDEAAFEQLVRKGRRQRPKFVRIPSVYNSRSKLTATISGDALNDLQFQLTSSGT